MKNFLKNLSIVFGVAFIGNLALGSYVTQDKSITQYKLAPRPESSVSPVPIGNIGISTMGTTFTTTSPSFVPITGLSTTLTTNGRPVFIAVTSTSNSVAGVPDPCLVSASDTNGTPGFSIAIYRGGSTNIADFGGTNTVQKNSGSGTAVITLPLVLLTIDPVSAGTYTYTVEIYTSGAGTNSVTVGGLCSLIAYEL